MNIRDDIEMLEDHARELRFQGVTGNPLDIAAGVFEEQAQAYDRCIAILQEQVR